VRVHPRPPLGVGHRGRRAARDPHPADAVVLGRPPGRDPHARDLGPAANAARPLPEPTTYKYDAVNLLLENRTLRPLDAASDSTRMRRPCRFSAARGRTGTPTPSGTWSAWHATLRASVDLATHVLAGRRRGHPARNSSGFRDRADGPLAGPASIGHLPARLGPSRTRPRSLDCGHLHILLTARFRRLSDDLSRRRRASVPHLPAAT
jgi:hypothetical protein